jgi:hypothetical protein
MTRHTKIISSKAYRKQQIASAVMVEELIQNFISDMEKKDYQVTQYQDSILVETPSSQQPDGVSKDS